jgi:hypothetical protein
LCGDGDEWVMDIVLAVVNIDTSLSEGPKSCSIDVFHITFWMKYNMLMSIWDQKNVVWVEQICKGSIGTKCFCTIKWSLSIGLTIMTSLSVSLKLSLNFILSHFHIYGESWKIISNYFGYNKHKYKQCLIFVQIFVKRLIKNWGYKH